MRAVKLIIKAFAALCALVVVCFFILANYSELPVIRGAIENVHACLNPDFSSKKLPTRMAVEIDGVRAVFDKDTGEYIQLVALLQKRRNLAFEKEWPADPSFDSRIGCGEMTIYNCGIPFHFPLYRSTANRNYYWIRVPNTTGMGYPDFYDDGKLLALIHEPRK